MRNWSCYTVTAPSLPFKSTSNDCIFRYLLGKTIHAWSKLLLFSIGSRIKDSSMPNLQTFQLKTGFRITNHQETYSKLTALSYMEKYFSNLKCAYQQISLNICVCVERWRLATSPFFLVQIKYLTSLRNIPLTKQRG